MPTATATATPTPKAVIHQRYGAKAVYRVDEVREAVDGVCPGLALPQIAIEKLGIQPTSNIPNTPEEAWEELISRISYFFTDENFPTSSHPLVGHLSVTLRRTGDFLGKIPISAIVACDVKVHTLCKIIDPKAEFDPLLVLSMIYNAAKQSPGVSVSNRNFWIQSQRPYSSEAVDLALQCWSGISDPIRVEAVLIPCAVEDEPKMVSLNISENEHYMGDIALKLSATDSSHVLVSRTVDKASSEMRFYFPAPDVQFVSDLSKQLVDDRGDRNMNCVINKRASYISGQTIYGDAVLANVGYTRRDTELQTDHVNLCTYYRILLRKLPDGIYKISKDSILVAELPCVYTRTSWKGPSPRDLLCSFCRLQRLSEPYFAANRVSASCNVLGSAVGSEEMGSPKATAGNQCANDGRIAKENPDMFKCSVKIYSKKRDLLLEYSTDCSWSKETDAIQNSALKVLIWFNRYFKQLNTPVEKLNLPKSTDGFTIYPNIFLQEFAMCLSVYGKTSGGDSRTCSAVGYFSMDTSYQQLESGAFLTYIDGQDSGVFPSHGSLACISCSVQLFMKDSRKRYLLEVNNEFEFEIGAGAVRNQLESCATQLSVNQSACFVDQLSDRDLSLAAACELSPDLSKICRDSCVLEFSVKVLQVTEPLEDRMEKALFNPPLSKQRVEFAVRHINQLHATTLVDFGCGSGSLLDSLLEHPTTLEKIVGVDISRKGLTRAAKSLHQKLSKKLLLQSSVPTAVLYHGSVTDFDSRLYGFDIGTCLEVIEHVEEDQASLFGNVVLSSFCPAVLIVSTPNYEYNPILQRSALPNKEEEQEQDAGPCKFRNHDHKFEWTRSQFQRWATVLAASHNYSVEFSGVGGSSDEPGYASQIAVFRRMARDQGESSRNEDDSHQPYEVLWEWPNASVPSH
ncbi:unnamed protein product [Triticum turgidum subsp. durum]|uniref:Small RNA 2'-O-methyltransferase n=1 Tax=Triticum turgidum subsp. durum TaxID=4567 RepID=A0A9R1PMB4_TRITD|nr:unnamed protein product [Triticum turgidum subsp. durum]